jgi:hypothetical protein
MSAGGMLGGIEEALLLLGRLEESDRRWILEHLPAAAKARLADGVGARDPRARLAAYDAGSVTEVLSAEPAWLVHAVLSAGHWPWKTEVIERLPATLRMEINGMARRGVTLAQPAMEFLLRAICERLETSRATPMNDLRFDSLVLDFTRRVDP